MKSVILTVMSICALSTAHAQQKWTLRQCIDHAVENNIEIRQTALNVENAEIALNTSQSSRLPSLNAGLGQNFSFGRTSVDAGGDNPVYQNTQTSSSSASLSTGVTIFQGFRINNQVRSDRLDLAAAAAGLERARQNLELNVASLYLDVLFKKEILAVYREQADLTRKQVENTDAMVKAEKAAASQLYEIEAQLAQNEVSVVNATNDLALSLLNLSQTLNLDAAVDFDIAAVVTDEVVFAGPLRLPDAIYDVAVETRPVVREAELRLRSSEIGVRIAQAGRMPSLSLSASAGAGYTYMFGQDFAQATLADQIRNRHSESVGLNLSIPIFNRNATRNNIRQARLGVRNQQLALEGVRQTLRKEIQQAWQGATAAAARYEATSKALTAAREAFRAMEVRYTGGKATAYEYSEATAKLVSSRSDQTQAKYDYLFRTKILDFYTGARIDI